MISNMFMHWNNTSAISDIFTVLQLCCTNCAVLPTANAGHYAIFELQTTAVLDSL